MSWRRHENEKSEMGPIPPEGYEIKTRDVVILAKNKNGEKAFWITPGATLNGDICEEGFWIYPQGEKITPKQRSRYLKWWEE